ncbi:hypothetical protein [Nannocystis pusilla]|uniref:hypothetical protein n=1 Tax=Nannocystis pusilla TaxID=889268 RepID=UPI003B82BBFB
MLFEFVFFMSAFYPSWRVVLGAFLVVAAMSLALGWWQRRLLRSHLEGAGAGKALAGGSMAVSSGRGPSEGLMAADRIEGGGTTFQLREDEDARRLAGARTRSRHGRRGTVP